MKMPLPSRKSLVVGVISRPASEAKRRLKANPIACVKYF
jgi:hypothetical protein